jgi:histidyl-tRNA synthetase
VPGVGISFGVDRIYDVMEELQVFPAAVQSHTQYLFFNLGAAESKAAFAVMERLRTHGISCELYHEEAKMDKQFKYAEKKGIAQVVIIGAQELAARQATIKDLSTGKQETVSLETFPI